MTYQCACGVEFENDPDAYLDHVAECVVASAF